MPKTEVKIPPLSGFDKSHHVLLTAKPGTLVPILCDEVIGNEPVDLESIFSAAMAPLATDTYMKVDLKVEAFFVPSRLLYGGFMDWLTNQPTYSPGVGTYKTVGIPHLRVSNGVAGFTGPGTLADYLGCRIAPADDPAVPTTLDVNILPWICYHRIYDDWYRAPLVQKKVFNNPVYDTAGFAGVSRLSTLPFVSYGNGQNKYFDESAKFDDGKYIFELRQRNFGFDYFTTALPHAQLGTAKGVSFTVSGGSGTISIAAIRGANSLQQFAERNELAGYRYEDYLRANYGADLTSGVAQRAVILGSGEIPVYSKGVYQTAPFYASDSGNPTANPFADTPGATYGAVDCSGGLRLVKDFKAQEPGWIMVLVSLVPKVTYSNGIERMFARYNIDESQTDMATPILQNVGNQPVYRYELTGRADDFINKGVFGWQDRYADFKYKPDRLAGLLRDGQSLDVFALQRSVTGSPEINSAFLQIPTDYLDQVAAVDGSISEFGYWLQVYHRYRVSMPLSPFAIPSLQDPAYEHGKSESIDVGGSRL